MEKAFTIHLKAFAPLLKNERIAYREVDNHLIVGNPDRQPGWVLYLSCKTTDTIEILELILDVLKKSKVSFSLIKDQLQQYALNAGAYGNHEVGKVLAIYPISENQATELATELCSLTATFTGPVIPEALQLGNTIYSQFAVHNGKEIIFKPSTGTLKKNPFDIPKQFRQPKRRKRVLGKYYIPVQLLTSSAKGDVFKAINLKDFAFNWCLIKQGKPAALDDQFQREMKDRLLWQKQVLDAIAGHVMTPKVIDYFENEGSGYLVMDYVEGTNLGQLIFEKHRGASWPALSGSVKIQLLEWYQKAIDIVISIHQMGFVHRDITDSNFIVLPDGSLCIIDFELSYNIQNQVPDPPFILGSLGYAAPEQLQYAVPDMKEDVYSMGALLCYLLSGLQPKEFIHENQNITAAKLHTLTKDPGLVKLVSLCLHKDRKSRPSLEALGTGISKYLSTLKQQDHAI